MRITISVGVCGPSVLKNWKKNRVQILCRISAELLSGVVLRHSRLSAIMDELYVTPRRSSLEIQLDIPNEVDFEWVHGDASHFCGAIVERCRDFDILVCPLCSCAFHIDGKPRDQLFQHLQEVHFSYEHGCVYKCATCKLQFATSKNAGNHLTTYLKHTLKCAICKATLEKNKVRSHFAGEHFREFCTALAEEFSAAGLDEMLDHIKAYAAFRRNNRQPSAAATTRNASAVASILNKSKRLVCGQICEFDFSEEDCCTIHEKYRKIYKRFSRNDVFNCPMCLKAYSEMPGLAIGHLILEHSLQLLSHKYSCSDCTECFGDVFEATNHVKDGHSLFCNMCSSDLQDIPSVREHLNRQHCSLVMEVTDRILSISPKRHILNELTSLCYRDGFLKCVTCSHQVPADAESYENHVILNHLDFLPVRCQWCQLAFTDQESKRHGSKCQRMPAKETPAFLCNLEGCGEFMGSTAEHYKEAHWTLIKPIISTMMDRARQLYPEWAANLWNYRERISSLQAMLSTVSPAIVDENCCQQNWAKPQILLEHIFADHVALEEPWFLFKVSADPGQRLACSLCEKPVFETTWVFHVIEYHGLIAQDAIDKRVSEIQSLCGFRFSITPMIDLPTIKAEVLDEVEIKPDLVDTESAAGPSLLGDSAIVYMDRHADEEEEEILDIKPMIFNFIDVAQDDAIDESGQVVKAEPVEKSPKRKRRSAGTKKRKTESIRTRPRLQRAVCLNRIDNLGTS